ncbi:alpha/beta hydrolase [Clostridium sp. JN-9]|uniref:alpha/beta hydrolase n=1 Tax=Clostridium sp. JN-9 TaxID=2507159 RepID=UPI000FFE105A|nr:alpha/beta hydrolase [Clostridium sp. JN-9]QAT39836.1 alpha/beta hydrolase [Clostridium sp. JN-9]
MNNNEETLKIINNMRNENINKLKVASISGKVIFIPTRAGKTRALIYKSDIQNKLSPVFFDIHGGGFAKGLPENDDKFCDNLRNDLNITVISIDYRLAPEYRWPSGIQDIYDAVSYVNSHNDEFGIDPCSMAIGGHSAGANIAAVVSMIAKEKGEFGLKCQILDYPSVDLAIHPGEKFHIEGAIPVEITDLFKKCYIDESDAKNPYCSPIYASFEQLKNLPPTVITTCEMDSLREEGEKYAEKLIKCGVETTAKRFYGAQHGFTIHKPELPESKESYKMIADGLKKYLLE